MADKAGEIGGTIGSVKTTSKEFNHNVSEFITKNSTIIMYITLPLYALISFIVYKFKKLNYSEHLVINLLYPSLNNSYYHIIYDDCYCNG